MPIPIKNISSIVRLPHDSHGLFIRLNSVGFPSALQEIFTREVRNNLIDKRVVLIHVSCASRIRYACGKEKCGHTERYEVR